jgi:UDP-N-acetyl-2-amino-2-deoxyglucuronate dehydrogenase
MKTFNFAIIGCGRIAQRHAEHIANYGRLVAVCDIIEERALGLARMYSCAAFGNVERMLTDQPEVDVVSVCTPNWLHARHSILSLNAGKHVVCEKPMALSSSDCLDMMGAARKAERYLFIVKQNRFNPPIVALKRALDEGWLGRIVNVQLNCFWNRKDDYYLTSDWKGKLALDGGTLFTQFSHFVDLILWFVGDVDRIYAISGNLMHRGIIEFEDTGVIALQFACGAMGTINYTVNSHKKNMEGSITVFGEKGTVKVGGQYLNVLEYQSIEGHEITNIPESRPPNEYGFYQGSMSNHDKIFENVINVLHGKAEIATTASEGMKTVELIERIYGSLINPLSKV